MNPQAERQLASKLLALSAHVQLGSLNSSGAGILWPQPDGRVLEIDEPHAQKFRNIASDLAKTKPWSDFFTES
ncbi:MAG: hypothetical protein ACR2OE_17860 [Thermomicrobiales bacterium]